VLAITVAVSTTASGVFCAETYVMENAHPGQGLVNCAEEREMDKSRNSNGTNHFAPTFPIIRLLRIPLNIIMFAFRVLEM